MFALFWCHGHLACIKCKKPLGRPGLRSSATARRPSQVWSTNSTVDEFCWQHVQSLRQSSRGKCLWPEYCIDVYMPVALFCSFYPRESFREGLWNHRRTFVCLSVCLFVCLSVTTITKWNVDGSGRNFWGRFLGGKTSPSSFAVTIASRVWILLSKNAVNLGFFQCRPPK